MPQIRAMRAVRLLRENIAALLAEGHYKQKDLADWCDRSEAWISAFLREERDLPLTDLDRIADFFGLATYQLFQPGISRHNDRRIGERRLIKERRRSHAQKIMIETAAEIERVRPVTGKRVHAEAAPLPDPIQTIIDKAVTEIRRLERLESRPPLADARRQATVARPAKTATGARPGTASRSDDSSRTPVKLPHK